MAIVKGYGLLSAAIAERMRRCGARVEARDIDVDGLSAGIALVAQSLAEPGCEIIVDVSGRVANLCDPRATEQSPVPVDDDGLRVDHVEAICGRAGAPLHHAVAPQQSGVTMNADRRERLITLATFGRSDRRRRSVW
jgi:DNA-binding transcriptional MocR family regulator